MYSFSLKPYSLSKIDLATFLAPSGVRASSTWRLTVETSAISEEKIAPAAVAERSSSAKSEADESAGSTMEADFGESNETSETGAISRALAAGRIVATSSKAAVAPQIATDFFELLDLFTFCSPFFCLTPNGSPTVFY